MDCGLFLAEVRCGFEQRQVYCLNVILIILSLVFRHLIIDIIIIYHFLQVASMASELKQKRTEMNKKIMEIADLGIKV